MKKKKTIADKINSLMRKARVPKYLHHFGPKKYTSRQHVKAWLHKKIFKAGIKLWYSNSSIYS